MRPFALLLLLLSVLPAAPALAAPIPDVDRTEGLPEYEGAATRPNPLVAPLPPRHPRMAPNERSNLHVDAYQTDTNVLTGPLGRTPSTLSTFYSADCASVTFDSRGRIVTVCVGLGGPTLRLLDPRTLDEIASFPLPGRQPGPPGGNLFQDFAGGGYFYLDDQDRAIIPTTTRHVFVVRVRGNVFEREQDIDLTGHVPQGDKIISALPDWSGRLWFVSIDGVVGTVDLRTAAVKSRDTGEHNGNSFAVDNSGAVYIVTNSALYRFEAAGDGTPNVIWRQPYANIGSQKPGQAQAGSGTTPTVMDGGLVAITDNADPMNVVVYKRGRRVSGAREICRQPVFARGASATDNSLIAAGRSLVVENNFGYTGPTSTERDRTTSPGIERVDVNRDGSGCRRVWRSNETAPSVVPKLSLGSGLVYTYTNPPNQVNGGDGWYLTGIEFRTGRTVFRRLTGEGLGFNNNYAPVTIGPDGTAYIGTLGGLVAVRDAAPPPQGIVNTSVRMDDSLEPKLRLRLLRSRKGRIRTAVTGNDVGLVTQVRFRLGNRKPKIDRGAPFSRIHRPNRRRRQTFRALATLSDGGKVYLKRTLRPRRR